jgi:hypothetical protein
VSRKISNPTSTRTPTTIPIISGNLEELLFPEAVVGKGEVEVEVEDGADADPEAPAFLRFSAGVLTIFGPPSGFAVLAGSEAPNAANGSMTPYPTLSS